jgi:O-antigen ligase
VTEQEKILQLIRLYCRAFFLSLVVGYLFYIGYYLDIVPLSYLRFFSVLTQIGYGFLRLSPGSYPNEYGICCSFVLSLVTWAFLNKKIDLLNISRKWLTVWYFLLGIGLLLTTTRAAYISYAFALIYLTWKSGYMRHLFFLSGALFAGAVLVLMVCGIDVFQVFSVGFDLANLESGSLVDRLTEWTEGFELFIQQPILGRGFASHSGLHNLYLQTLFELGMLGLITFAGALTLYFFDRGYLKFQRFKESDGLSPITVLGMMHVLWFAANNHNLNHHLTWFVIFLWLSLRRISAQKLTTLCS